MDEYKKQQDLMEDQAEQSNSSEEIEETAVEVAPQRVTWKLLPVRNKRPEVYHIDSDYVRQNSPNRPITIIPTEKVPLEKISLKAFRNLPLPSYRSTLPIAPQVSVPKCFPEDLESDNDGDIFAELAQILNFKNESQTVVSSPIYNPDSQRSEQSVDDRSSQEVSSKDENWRYTETRRSTQGRESRSKRRNEDSTDRNDRKRRRGSSESNGYTSVRRSRRDVSGERVYETMLRAKQREMRALRSPLKNFNFACKNTWRTYSSRTSEPGRRSQHRGGRPQRFNNNRTYSNRIQKERTSFARRSSGRR